MDRKIVQHPPLKKLELLTVFCIADLHGKHLDLDLWDKTKLLTKKCESPPMLLINGDLFDFFFLMKKQNPNYNRHLKHASGIEDYFIPMFEEEVKWGNKFLDDAQKYFYKIVFIRGNHDERPYYFIHDDCPSEYAHNFDLSVKLRLQERGIVTVAYNDWYDIEDLSFTHGQFHGATAHKKHYGLAGKSVMFSHIHKEMVIPMQARNRNVKVYSTSCMCGMSPYYMKNRDNDWTGGFNVINFFRGNHWVHPMNYINGRLLLPSGELL